MTMRSTFFASILLSFSLLLITYSAPARAGAWLQNEDGLFLATTASTYQSRRFFDNAGHQQDQPTFSKYEFNAYAEWGYDDDITLGANLFLHTLEQSDIQNYGIGDPELFARYLLWKTDDLILSAQPLVKLPSWYSEDYLPKAGGDQWDGELSLLSGYSFQLWDQWHYLDQRLGYRHRTGSDIANQWKADIKLGLRLNADLIFQPAVYTTWAAEIPNQATFAESGQNDYDLVKLEASMLYYLSPTQYIQAGISSHVEGRNTGSGYGLFMTTGYQW